MKFFDSLFNVVCLVGGVVGGLIVSAIGGWDKFAIGLLALQVIDYATGLIKSGYQHKLSSEVGFKGIWKKVIMWLVVVTSVVITYVIGNIDGQHLPIREITLCFYISNEGLSIIENALIFVPVPDKIKDIFMQLREGSVNNEQN